MTQPATSPNPATTNGGQPPALQPPAPPATPPHSESSKGVEVPPAPAADSAAAPAKPAAPRKPLPENVSAALSYLLGWVSGLVFLLIDRRPFVRSHAARSVKIFATLSVVLLVLSDFFLGTFLPNAGGALLALRRVVELVWFVSAVGLMLKAALGERSPVAAGNPETEPERASKVGRAR